MEISNMYINQNRIFAFIDETGNTSLEFEKDGVSSHFIITAVLVDESKLNEVEEIFHTFKVNAVQNGEIKSSSIGKNHKRRKFFLEKLRTLDYKTYTLVVDKASLYRDGGLGYKQVFIKHLNDRLHTELRLAFPKLTMIADEHGSKRFMDGFRKFVDKRSQRNLFDECDFDFSDSKSKELVQLADLIAGTISFKYEKNKDRLAYNDFKPFIEEKAISIIEWPVKYDNYIEQYSRTHDGKYDEVISLSSIRLAINFIEKYKKSDVVNDRECVLVLKHLLSTMISSNKNEYVNSSVLRMNLKYFTATNYTSQYFKTRIIARLRDENVLISSSSKGYKIPENEEDIIKFINHSNSMIQPMLNRVKKAQHRVYAATNGELDILDKESFKKLRKMTEM